MIRLRPRKQLQRAHLRLRPYYGLILGTAAGVPLGIYGLTLGALTGFLVHHAIRQTYRSRLPRQAEALLTLARYCGRSRELPAGLVSTGFAVLARGGFISAENPITLPRGRQLPVLRRPALETAQQLRHELDDTTRRGLAEALRESLAAGELGEVETREVLEELQAPADLPDRGELEKAALLLGIPENASREDARRAYRRLATQFHPDAAHGLTETQKAEAGEAFRRIREAYEIYTRGE